MKRLLTTVGLLGAILAGVTARPAGQAGPPPAGHARLAQSAEGKAVLVPVDGLFAALEAGDAAAVLRHVQPDGRVTAAGRRPDGGQSLRQQTWAQFAERITPERAFQERITDPVISIDDDIASVWAPFVVRVGGKVNNCGIDHFDLVRVNGTWTIVNLTYSSRTTGCPAR